jgi:hypothetical protein
MRSAPSRPEAARWRRRNNFSQKWEPEAAPRRSSGITWLSLWHGSASSDCCRYRRSGLRGKSRAVKSRCVARRPFADQAMQYLYFDLYFVAHWRLVRAAVIRSPRRSGASTSSKTAISSSLGPSAPSVIPLLTRALATCSLCLAKRNRSRACRQSAGPFLGASPRTKGKCMHQLR